MDTHTMIHKLFVTIIIISSCTFATVDVVLFKDNSNATTLQFTMSQTDYTISGVAINSVHHNRIVMPDGVYDEPKGCPDLPRIAQSMIIPNRPKMKLEILDTKFTDIPVAPIAPFKGHFSRKINPEDVPYEFGDVYTKEGWYPKECAHLGIPYIARHFRAHVVYFQPFLYNPQTKTLRIFTEITVRVSALEEPGINIKSMNTSLDIGPNFHQIYSRRFINYQTLKYTPVDEEGTMLIISDGAFIDAMQPFIAWKNKRGIKTEIVDIADVGRNASSIKTYVENYYAANDLKYLLLVGDNQEVPTSYNGSDPSDNVYGCIEGNDSYVEVFVGRLSGTTATHIQTQVEKVLFYEREIKGTDTWLNKGYGSYSTSEQDDRNAITHIRQDLEAFTYTSVGYTEGQESLVNAISNGMGCHINSSHGSKTSISGLNTGNVSSMRNNNQYPFNYTLACNPGDFESGGDCLGEALLKKQGGGYVGAFMASMSQPWDPPYAAIHEHTDILTEQYTNNIKRTYGGIAHNGCMKMIDDYRSSGPKVSDCWILFGDPSMLVYTDAPNSITINHPAEVGNGTQEITVSGTEDATVCLYNEKLGIQEVKKLTNGTALFSLQINADETDSLAVTATAFNYETYEGTIAINTGPYIAVATPRAGEEVWAGDEIAIQWNTGGGANVANVTIEYSTDNGSSYTTIIASTANAGSYTWQVPDVNESDQCMIRITDAAGSLNDVSGVFTIKQKAHVSLSQNTFDVVLRPNTSVDKTLTIANTGKGRLNFTGAVAGAAKILINELYVSGTAFFDGFELWNQGTDADISGWQLQWNDNENSSGSYTFPSGFMLNAGKTMLFVDDESMANDSTVVYCGSNLSWDRSSTELSIALLDKDGNGVDFVRSSGNNDTPPAGTEWSGTGVSLSSDYVYRTRNQDSDDATDWTANASGTPNQINQGQTQSSGHWLVLSPTDGIVDPLSSLDVTVRFNASGIAEDIYYDTIYIAHNDPDNQSPIAVPCKLTVDASVAISDNSQKDTDLFMVRYMPSMSNGTVYFNITTPSAKKHLRIVNCLGNLVYEDNDGDIEPWHFTNRQGERVASGMYFIVLTIYDKGKVTELRRTVLGVK